MEEKVTKTSGKQRLIIIIVAIVMIGSFLAVYIGIIMNGQKASQANDSKVDQAKVAELKTQYEAKQKEVEEAAKPLSDKYLPILKKYKGLEVKSYNSATANNEGLKTKDLEIGTGAELKSSNTDYFAYYIGWCSDESIFDSSFDDAKNPTKLKAPLDASMGLIEGWNQGVVGMKLGGVRELTIPGNLAYGESQEICGGKNSPLKFIVVAMEKTEPLKTKNAELSEILNRLQYASYGLDYDSINK